MTPGDPPTPAATTEPPELPRNDPARIEDELRHLVVALRITSGGELFFVELDSSTARRELPAALAARGVDRTFRYVDLSDLSEEERQRHPIVLLQEWVAKDPGVELLYVDGIEAHADFNFEPRPGDVLEQLNLSREALARLGPTIVFLMPGYLVDLLSRHAHNLWTWRAYDFDLGSGAPEEIGPLERYDGDWFEPKGAFSKRLATLRRLYAEDETAGRRIEDMLPTVVLPLARALGEAGRHPEQLTLLQRCRSRLRPRTDPLLLMELDLAEADALLKHGRLDEAERLIERVEAARPERSPTVRTLSLRGRIARERGQLPQARRYGEELIQRLAQGEGSTREAGDLFWWLGVVEWRQGALAQARGDFERAAQIHEQLHDGQERIALARDLYYLSKIELELARDEEAAQLSHRALTLLEHEGGPAVAIMAVLRQLARLYERQGRWADALVWAERQLKLVESVVGKESLLAALTLWRLIDIHRALGHDEEVAKYQARLDAIPEPAPVFP